MRKVYSLILLNSLFFSAVAQNFEWAKCEGLWAYDYGNGITTDNTGNVYVAGKYEDHANFSGTILPCAGNHDTFLAKYSSTGSLNWIRTSGGDLGDYAHAIACDGSSNVYIAGEIEGYGNLVTFPGSSITLHPVGDNDVFAAKYDLNGNLAWAVSAGGNHNDKALGITFDNSGNVYICGLFTDTATFGTTTIYGHGHEDIFIAKYDVNGNFVWVRHAGSAGRDEAKSIKCDAAGNVYICGMISDGCVFGTQTLSSPGGYFDTFLAKYAPDGTLIWVKTGGGDYDDVAWSLTIDNAGKIYITGEFNSYALFYSYVLSTQGNSDIFVACYDASGNLQWAKQAGGSLVDRARGIGCDGTNLYITGQFGGSASFGLHQLNSADSSDIFIAELSNTGIFLWATSVSGVADSVEYLGYESGNSITADASGNVYATGGLLNGGTFGSISCLPYKRTDVFITKLTPADLNVSATDISKNIKIYPNPGNGNYIVDLSKSMHQKNEITIFNCLGQCIEKRTDLPSSKINFDLSAHKKGVYFIEIKTDQTMYREKIILQ